MDAQNVVFLICYNLGMKQVKTSIEEETLHKNRDKYRGYIVMVIEDKIFAAKSAKKAYKIVEEIEKKYHKRPLITNIPKADTLILPIINGNFI